MSAIPRLSLPLCALAAIFALTAFANPASAALVEKKREPWQHYVEATCFGTTSNCSASIYTVPARRRLEVKHVSCLVGVSAGLVPYFVRLHLKSKDGEHAYDTYLPEFTDDTAVNDLSVVNTETFFIAEAGGELEVQTTADANAEVLHCTVSGELVTLKKKKKNK
jgi:hypothetical protein